MSGGTGGYASKFGDTFILVLFILLVIILD